MAATHPSRCAPAGDDRARGRSSLAGLALRLYFIERWRPALIGFPRHLDLHPGRADGDLQRPAARRWLLGVPAADARHPPAPVVRDLRAAPARAGERAAAVRRRPPSWVSGWVALVPAAVVILGGLGDLRRARAAQRGGVHLPGRPGAVRDRARMARRLGMGGARRAGARRGDRRAQRRAGAACRRWCSSRSLAAPGAWRRRLLAAALVVLAAALPIGLLPASTRTDPQGYGGFTGAGYFDLYARVAPFANCSKFHPARRHGETLHSHSALAAARPRRLGVHRESRRPSRPSESLTSPSRSRGRTPSCAPSPRPRSSGNRSNTSNTSGGTSCGSSIPSFPARPMATRARRGAGYGNTPQSLTDYYFNTSQHLFASTRSWPPTTRATAKSTRASRSCSTTSATLVSRGRSWPCCCCWRCSPRSSRRPRSAARRCSSCRRPSCCSLAPILTSEYDYRFTIPAFGPLAATAAIGAWAATVRVRPLLVRALSPLSDSDRRPT